MVSFKLTLGQLTPDHEKLLPEKNMNMYQNLLNFSKHTVPHSIALYKINSVSLLDSET